jgi:hypothetical protein
MSPQLTCSAQGNSPTMLVAQNKVVFQAYTFDIKSEVVPPKKKGAAPARIPVMLTIQQLVAKKLKEVAACELNLADFATRQAQPYAVRIKVD